MKTILLSLLVVLFFSFTSQKQVPDQTGSNKCSYYSKLECPAPPLFETIENDVNKHITEKDPESIDQDWYGKAMKNIEKAEYNISFSHELGEYQSPNRKNNIRFVYHKDRFTAVTRDVKRETEDEWSIDFRVSNMKRQMLASRSGSNVNGEWSMVNDEYSHSTPSTDFNKSEIIASGNKAFIENSNIRIDYTNDEDGMRQDFIIKNRPNGEGKLRLNLSADTKLKMIVEPDGLMFKNKNGIEKMKYSSLKCWDANGRELRAYFEKSPLREARNIKNENAKIPASQGEQIKNQKSEIESKFQIQNSNFQIEKDLKSKIKNQKLFTIVVSDKDAVYPITIDPLSSSPDWSAESNQAGAKYGYSVSSAGDVNGDGYADVIVGAPYFDNGLNNAGKTFVYHGSAAGLSAIPNWSVEGNSDALNLGISVSTAGDVNNDGYSDVVTGTLGNNIQWASKTSGTIEHLQDLYFTSNSTGWASGSGGIIIKTTNTGNTWSTLTTGTTQDLRSIWFVSKDTGWAVGLAGTIRFTTNGGTSWTSQTPGASPNLSCVYFKTSQTGWAAGASGNIRMTTNAGVNWSSQTSGLTAELRDVFFTSLTTGWIVGTTGKIIKTTDGGTVWNQQTSGTTQTLRAVHFSSENTGWAFGHAGTILYTTNGGTNWNSQASGTAEDLYGCSFTSALTGWAAGFGSAVLKTTNGGTNWELWNNGISNDLRCIFFSAVDSGFAAGSNGTLYKKIPADNNGAAYVFHGSASGLPVTANYSLTTNANVNYSENIVSDAGDVNNDGYDDVIIGSPVNTDAGKVFIYHGSASGLITSPATILPGQQDGSLFGSSVNDAGDVNNDGYDDIIIGAPNFTTSHFEYQGKAYVYRGSASGIVTSALWSIVGTQDSSKFGFSVSSAGDVNGDGYSDIIVGCPEYDSVDAKIGKAFVFHGAASGVTTNPKWTSSVTEMGAQFGYCVSSAGDINGDGYSDVVVGAPYYSSHESERGSAYLFTGTPAGLSPVHEWSQSINQGSAHFGNSVSSAGDITNDGYSDVIIGARDYDNGQNNEGKAFVYYGFPVGPKSLNLTLLIQGFYNSSSDLMVPDTVKVFLRSDLSPYGIYDSAVAMINSAGTGTFVFQSPFVINNIDFYLQTSHRNSIETWSKTTPSFIANAMTYDFTTAANNAFGNNMIQVDASPVKFAVYGGDVNQDGVVDGTDGALIDNDAFNFVTGYAVSDLTGDNVTDGSDAAIADNNAANFVTKITPS